MFIDGVKSRWLSVLIAIFIWIAALPYSPALSVQRRLEVLPVLFVPSDNTEVSDVRAHEYMEQIYRHLVLAQRHWLNVLETDTFAISAKGTVYRARQPHAFYKPTPPTPDIAIERILLELFALHQTNRIDSSYIYLIVYAVPSNIADPGALPGGGRTFNGIPNTGGGFVAMVLSSLITDKIPYKFQSTLVHEIGHTIGLTHPDCHGYELDNNPSFMSYSPFLGRSGLEQFDYPKLNPEDYFVIAQNKLAFPNFRYVESIHNPKRKPLVNIEECYLGPMSERLGVDERRKLHGAGYELFFDGKLVSGPGAPFMSQVEAIANCQGNKTQKRGISVTCRYNGKSLVP